MRASGGVITPTAVPGGQTFTSLSTGEGHTCALTASGSIWCWGLNNFGQLGNESAGFRESAPVQVSGGLTFTAVVAGAEFSCALTSAGVAYCWGDNRFGQLGSGDAASRAVPRPVAGGLHFVALAAGLFHACGLTSSGNAWCWGKNSSGELGDGTTDSSYVPVAVTGGLTFASIGAGD